jgi:hypothetical protein
MDDGDRNFDHGTVTNRLDILSEFDLIYQKGLRISGKRCLVVRTSVPRCEGKHLGRDLEPSGERRTGAGIERSD